MASSISLVVRAAALAAALGSFALTAPRAKAAEAEALPAASSRIRAFLDASGSPQPLCSMRGGSAVWAHVRALYSARAHEPAWTSEGELTAAGRALVKALGASANDGLDPARYDPVSLAGARVLFAGAPTDGPLPTEIADVGLTTAFLLYAADLARGRLGEQWRPFWRPRSRGIDLADRLAEAVNGARPDDVLAALRPVHPQYAALQSARARYQALAMDDHFEPLAPMPRLRMGQRAAQVPALRRRLAVLGDLGESASARNGLVFDRRLAEAVRRFQVRHGLTPHGQLDATTTAALNVPLAERVRQIDLNLERWRSMAAELAPRALLVNIPSFTLHAFEERAEVLRMRVITGNPDTPTPVFGESMTAVVFSPYWNVPSSIAINETVPAVLRDASFLRRRGFEVLRGDQVVDPRRVDWRREAWDVGFRQRPGPGNALGLVKFLVPNPFGVYLHDTPGDGLFARPRRAFSHGCVRLEKPAELARWVLGTSWTSAEIARAMRTGRERHVPLDHPIPVSVTYLTAWAEDDGQVRFLPDLYGHDAAQRTLLEAPPAAAVEVAVVD